MAGSIPLFQFVQNFRKTMGIVENQPNQRRFSINLEKVVFQFYSIQLMITTGAFAFFKATSVFEFGSAFYMCLVAFNINVVYILLASELERTSIFIRNCERFIKKRVHSTVAYRELIGKIELFNQYFWYAMCITFAIVALAPLPYTLARFFIYDMEEDSFYLFAPSWYPFNWRTLTGYPFAFLAQIVGVVAIGKVYVQFLNLFFGSCWLFMFIAEDIANDVKAFNAAAQSTDGNRAKMTKRFCDLVQIYSDAKQCVKEFNQIYEYPLLSFFTWTMLGLANSLLTLQFELWADAETFKIIILSYVVFTVIIYILILCEPGARMTKHFEMLEDELSQCHWHLLSIKVQRMYMVFLSEAQNGMKISSYGGIICERNTAKQILNAAFSYFMTFRRFRG